MKKSQLPPQWSTSAKARSAVFCVTLGALILAAGCGFQLRGAAPVSAALQPLALQCANDTPIDVCQAVRQQLALGEVALSDISDAKYVLSIGQYNQDRRASAITANAGAAEYTLRQSVSINLVSVNKVPLIADTRLHASESYRYDETNVLAKQREEQVLQIQLQERLAQQIIFRLAPLTQSRIDAIEEQHQQKTEQPAGSPDKSDGSDNIDTSATAPSP